MTLDQFTNPSDKQPGEFRRTAMGAPRVTRPDDPTELVTYRRPSGFAVEPNTYDLMKWKERQLVTGLLAMLGDETMPTGDRDALDRLINDAYDAADTSLAADRGTHVHTLTQYADKADDPTLRRDRDRIVAHWDHLYAQGELLGIPSALQAHIVKEWRRFRAELGVRARFVEAPVVNDEHRAAGTVDRHDEILRDIDTPLGRLVAGDLVVGDIKTGGFDTYADGTPKYWTKYGQQLALYSLGVRYDVDAEQRIEWEQPPRADIALLYHYDLKAAIDGETALWRAIPVDLRAARHGVEASQAIHDYAKRRDVFHPPLEVVDRRAQLLQRYHELAPVDQERFRSLGVPKDDLDAIEAALDAVDPFCTVTEPERRERGAA